MGWMPGINRNPGQNAENFGNARQNIRCHFTVGTDSTGIGLNGYFHFLVPKVGVPQQFAPTEAICWDACEWNPVGWGIEFERMSGDEPLTPDQITWGGNILRWGSADSGIPLTFRDTPDDRMPVGTEYHGVTTHRSLHENACPEHFDFITQSDFDAMLNVAPPPPPIPPEEDDSMVARYRFGDNIRTVMVDARGNVKHRWWSNGWHTDTLTGPDSASTVKVPALVGSASADVGGFGGGPNRVDIFAESADGSGKQIHAYWTGSAWLADLTP